MYMQKLTDEGNREKQRQMKSIHTNENPTPKTQQDFGATKSNSMHQLNGDVSSTKSPLKTVEEAWKI